MNNRERMPEGKLTFTIEEAAALLGISTSTAYESIHRGELAALHFGRRLVVTRPTLEALLGIGTPANDASNQRRRPRRTHWILVPAGHVQPVSADWARPHRRRSAE
jgi:excisionase family DNA binding protein